MAIRLVGTTASDVRKYFLGVKAGGRKMGPAAQQQQQDETNRFPEPIRIWGILVFSACGFFGGMVMLFSKSADTQKAGIGFIGLVLGYWLR